jgi:hypothetical protein
MLVFTAFGAFGSTMAAAPPLEGQLGPLASADCMPIPPIIRKELTAKNAMVARRIALLFILYDEVDPSYKSKRQHLLCISLLLMKARYIKNCPFTYDN